MPTRHLRLAPPGRTAAASTDAHPTSEARLRVALATAEVGAWDWDLAAGRVSWNVAHERICGYAPGAFGGDLAEFLALVLDEDRAGLLHAVDVARDGRTELVHTYRVRRRDGDVRWVRGRGIFFYDAATGAATHAAGTIVDITEARIADEARVRSEERLALALDGAEQALWEWDGGAGLFVASARAETMLGYAAGEVGQRLADWRALVHPDDVPGIERALAAHAHGRTPVIESEHRMRAKDGSWRWVLARGKVAEHDAAGRPTRALGTHIDVTERHLAAEALRDSEARFAAMFANASIGIWLVDNDERPIAANAALCRILGYTEAELCARSVWDVTHPEDRERERALLAERLAQGEGRARTEKRYVRKDGTTVWVRLEVSLVLDPGGAPLFRVGIVEDVTAQRHTREVLAAREQQLREAQKLEAVGKLAGGIAHDFNNLLTVVLGNLAFAHDALDAAHPAQADLREAASAAERARMLVRQLLAFSRQQVRQTRVLDLAALVRDSELPVRRVLPATVRFATHTPAPALVHGDPAQLQQAVLNLVLNARDAMPDGGELAVATAHATLDDATAGAYGVPPGAYVTLAVRDTGTGMDEATRERAFEPFFTTKPVGKGTGLGLAIVYGVVRDAGGGVCVRSAPGAGTTITIALPPARPDGAAAAPAAALSAPA